MPWLWTYDVSGIAEYILEKKVQVTIVNIEFQQFLHSVLHETCVCE